MSRRLGTGFNVFSTCCLPQTMTHVGPLVVLGLVLGHIDPIALSIHASQHAIHMYALQRLRKLYYILLGLRKRFSVSV